MNHQHKSTYETINGKSVEWGALCGRTTSPFDRHRTWARVNCPACLRQGKKKYGYQKVKR